MLYFTLTKGQEQNHHSIQIFTFTLNQKQQEKKTKHILFTICNSLNLIIFASYNHPPIMNRRFGKWKESRSVSEISIFHFHLPRKVFLDIDKIRFLWECFVDFLKETVKKSYRNIQKSQVQLTKKVAK